MASKKKAPQEKPVPPAEKKQPPSRGPRQHILIRGSDLGEELYSDYTKVPKSRRRSILNVKRANKSTEVAESVIRGKRVTLKKAADDVAWTIESVDGLAAPPDA